MTKIRNYVSKDWIVKTTVERSVKYRWKYQHRKIQKNAHNKYFIAIIYALKLYF